MAAFLFGPLVWLHTVEFDMGEFAWGRPRRLPFACLIFFSSKTTPASVTDGRPEHSPSPAARNLPYGRCF